ncbi:hypothetical protein B0I72DRAFT_8541 [Yarrowia lipolytica]|uniref:YALI0A12419p n=2 Tax=Yarrowia lipolytica TaxID=4952 RepID=Q6CH49_YARLI|nr:YALI0A12419p [Yarrowia lipolytica CLIB122]AOW00568.1 hypothetical protein YALI1_A12601g [Yarrowia lipolytica]KAB8280015.1 hypothetical protein BKA91DRAFT_50023 [Yarrowia lipolytica]KAE8168774.1 hypothetical protein BKA90DRAFT_8820 [Yarrowia lipolytica]KAJ8051617.1 hypothetical protein LXG23DRAFT_27388 [Yarrowia lipolytica]RDW24954.1 hypothetical protein B0I71DRAFT_44960 [Yarrowia lipolytica]|eukprot:XP_500013.2 YALI0A12419p [Yarrowia lipolytica CLIB122]
MSIFGTPSMFGRPIDPFQHLMNMRCAHEAAHNRFRTQMSSSDPEVRQTGLSNHHLYLKQLLDEQAGYETDLFKCLKHIDRAVAQWTELYRLGKRSEAQRVCNSIAFEFRDTCMTLGFRALSQKEKNELLLDICLAYEEDMGANQLRNYKL